MKHWSEVFSQVELRTAQIAYRDHVNRHARGKRRDRNRHVIKVLLTFEEWMDIWWQSGQWHQRGNQTASHCVMSRINDLGDYCVGNVEIITHGENVRRAGVHTWNGGVSNKKKKDWANSVEGKRDLSIRAVKSWKDPLQRENRSNGIKQHFEDPIARITRSIANGGGPVCLHGVYYESKIDLIRHLGKGKNGSRSPELRVVTLEEYLMQGSRK